MALTFSDFMLGLAKSAPMLADTISKYTMYQMQQYEMVGQQKLREQQGQYYEQLGEGARLENIGKLTDIEKGKIDLAMAGMEKEHLAIMIPLQERVQQLVLNDADINAKIKQDEQIAYENLGGREKYIETRLGNDAELQQLNINREKASITALGDQHLTLTAQRKLAELNSKITYYDFTNTVRQTFHDTTKDPKALPEMQKTLEQFFRGDNVDFPGLSNYIKGNMDKFNSPLTMARLAKISDYIDQTSINIKSGIENEKLQQEALFTDILLSGDDKKTKALEEKYGIKDEATMKRYLDTWYKTKLSEPFLKTWTDMATGWTDRSKEALGIPDYTTVPKPVPEPIPKPVPKPVKKPSTFERTQTQLGERFAGTGEKPTSIYSDIGTVAGKVFTPSAPLTVEQMATMTKKEKEEYERRHRRGLKTQLPTY